MLDASIFSPRSISEMALSLLGWASIRMLGNYLRVATKSNGACSNYLRLALTQGQHLIEVFVDVSTPLSKILAIYVTFYVYSWWFGEEEEEVPLHMYFKRYYIHISCAYIGILWTVLYTGHLRRWLSSFWLWKSK